MNRKHGWTAARRRLQNLVEQLPESEVATAIRVLEALKAVADPLADAHADDEPTTDEDLAAIVEGWEQYRQGKGTFLPQA